jgi:hypothetical protein
MTNVLEAFYGWWESRFPTIKFNPENRLHAAVRSAFIAGWEARENA